MADCWGTMDQAAIQFAFGLIIGIVMIWVGIILVLASLPLARGEANARTYNYRPWQPKFVKKLSDEEANMIGKKFAKYAIYAGFLMMLLGVVSIVLGTSGHEDIILLLLNLSVVLLLISILISYSYSYQVSKHGIKR